MDQTEKILVVDDEEAIRSVFKNYLEATRNYTVLTAKNGLEALEIVEREPISCCFTDLAMPLLDGVTLSERIHAYDNTIPVIVMTGFPTMDNAIRTLKNGVVDFLTKPINMDQILATIERIMQERSLFVHNILSREGDKRNGRLLEASRLWQQEMREVETMSLILRRLDDATTRRDLFNLLVELSGQITSCDEAHFCIFGQDMERPAIISSFFRENKRTLPETESVDREIIIKVAQDAMPLLVKKNTAGESILSVPLKVKNSVFGILISLIRDGEHSFSERDLYFLNFLAEKASFSIENVALYENIYENLFAVHYAFVEAIEARDPYTKQHSTRVANYAVSIAMAVGCSRDEMDALRVSSNLHDIGKIGVPDHILLKPDRLTDDEYEVIKKHPLIGGNIIGHFSLWAYPQKIIKHHHERWDGKGYPDGLTGRRIPLFSRILSVADVYDALTSDRSYRKKLSGDAAVKIIKENTGYMFDPMIVDTFLQLYNGGRVGDC